MEAVVDIVDVAAGGVCVARHEGQVVFVTGAIPGERVRIEITGSGKGGKFLRGRVVEVLTASPDRIEPPCPYFGVCGGCDWQHVALGAQRGLKAKVLSDALTRIGKFTEFEQVSVLAATPTEDGTRWRSRIRLTPNEAGRLGFRAQRSHDVVVINDCLIADVEIPTHETVWPSEVILASDVEWALGRQWHVGPRGFWQAHVAAPELLADEVRQRSALAPGEIAADLYAGVGVFAAVMAEQVGVTGSVHAVESNSIAAKNAKRNLADLTNVQVHAEEVVDWLYAWEGQLDSVVLDPPRTGLGRAVVDELVRIRPTTIVYISCDPASFARDLRWLADGGMQVRDVTGYDFFPMTAHLEAVATLTVS